MSRRKVMVHPTYQARLKEVGGRFVAAQKTYREVCDRLWAGMLADFSPEDLAVLPGSYFSERDRRILGRLGRPAPERHADGINCPYCGHEAHVEIDGEEQELPCPGCRQILRVQFVSYLTAS